MEKLDRQPRLSDVVGNQRGFTLIELIIVIVVLGILAATAIPKYFDMRVDAREAAVDGLAGGISGAAAIAHAACLMSPTTCSVTSDGTTGLHTVTLGGTAVDMKYGYPAATAAGITAAMDYTAGQFTADYTTTVGTAQFYLGILGTDACQVNYVAAASGGSATITPVKTDCDF